MKISTPLALGALALLIILAVSLSTYFLNKRHQELNIFQPTQIQVFDINDSSAIITWQTDTPATGSLDISTDPVSSSFLSFLPRPTINISDPRDTTKSENRKTHYILLRNLLPNTTYYYKIRSNNYSYSTKSFHLTTKSALKISNTQWKNSQPLIGKVVNTNLQPITDGIVFLKANNQLLLATPILQNGEFILPLQDLGKLLSLSNTPSINATLVVTNTNLKSNIKIKLPNNLSLIRITLGEDQNLSAGNKD